MAKAGKNVALNATTAHRVHLELDSLVRDIEYCRLENIKFEPDATSFQFTDGKWIADHTNFPIDSDNILDVMIIVTGNPGTTPVLTIQIDSQPAKDYQPFAPVSANGRTFFSPHIPI